MNTIEKEAEHYSEICGFQSNYPHDKLSSRDGFKAGVEFAQRWIPVGEELPCHTTLDLHNAVNVKFKTIHGYERECTATLESVSQHCFENSPYHNRWYVYPSGGHELKTVTHWRPIERM
jgi:hypothetical protein